MPWNRKKSTVDVQVPPEVEEYYQSTQKDRRGMAWLLAFATLILTILIAVFLFFAGRWAYNAVFGDDSSSTTQTEEQTAGQDGTSGQDSEASAEDDALVSPDSPSGTDNGQEATLPPESGNNSQDGAAGGTTPGASQPGSSQTPTTGPNDPEIPRTGPTEE